MKCGRTVAPLRFLNAENFHAKEIKKRTVYNNRIMNNWHDSDCRGCDCKHPNLSLLWRELKA